MKKKFLRVGRIVAIAITIVCGSMNAPTAFAGSSDIAIDNTSFATTIDESTWNVPNDDVVVENAKLVFGKDSTEETRLITKRAIVPSDYHEELFRADYTLKIKQLPAGEKFIVALNLVNIESYSEEAGNVEVIFENQGGLKVSVKAYDENGEETVLASSQSFGGSLGQNINIHMESTRDMKLQIQVNNKEIYKQKAPVDLKGRFGFLQSGSCVVEVSNVDIVTHKYDRPENTNIIEDFESGTINVNTLASKMFSPCKYYPAGIQVEKYGESNVLMFRNVATGYISTVHQYSNFEMTFDIPYMLHSSLVAEDGTLQAPNNLGLAVSFGDEKVEVDGYGYTTAADAILCQSKSLAQLKGNKLNYQFGNKQYYTPGTNEGYSIKLLVVDAQVTVSIKALDAKKYDEVLSYKIGNSNPLGYVHIWATGQSNFAIDNLKITNLDMDANLLDLDYKEGFVTGTEDWKYESTEAEYLKVEESTDEFDGKLVFVIEMVASIVILLTCVLIARRKKAPKTKGVQTDEM